MILAIESHYDTTVENMRNMRYDTKGEIRKRTGYEDDVLFIGMKISFIESIAYPYVVIIHGLTTSLYMYM